MIGLPYLAQIVAGYHLRFSPKVIVPGFIGLSAIAVTCGIDRYGYKVDFGTVALCVVQVMIFLGWLVPDPDRIKGKDIQQ